ncbi:hypothetical protein NDU88_007159 [Pleurodeles waltl]|uniref:Uncharacterized protein n=1 Tax=Pleurodeles waltl TaxID=8319 RepID=A0AAV7NV58_PLEWA|nr:hypothetical protein NDU88_007159 [Pleurodeles waltl]
MSGRPMGLGAGVGGDPKGVREERPLGEGSLGHHNEEEAVPPRSGTVQQPTGDLDGDRVPQAQEGDPIVPISQKWPTIFQWSGSEEEEEGAPGEVAGQDGEDSLGSFSCRIPRQVYGKQERRLHLPSDNLASVHSEVEDGRHRDGIFIRTVG